MATKRTASRSLKKKSSSKKKSVRGKIRIAKKTEKPAVAEVKKLPFSERKIKAKSYTAVREIIIFAVIFVISMVLYSVSSEEFYSNLFWIISFLSGFALLAFLIAWLVLAILRYFGK